MSKLYRYIDSDTGELKTTENTISTISGNYFVEPITLDASQIANKQITLVNTPGKPDATTVNVSKGIQQDYSVDFIVVGNVLSWNGYGMETLLEEGDKIKIGYII